MTGNHKIPLETLRRYVEDAHGVIEVVGGMVEARFPIHIETRGESIYFVVKGRLLPDNMVEITGYVVERGDDAYERPSDELEGWLIVVHERYSREAGE